MTNLLVIGGPTATGKTDLAIHLAQKLNGEIISADSRQVYKDMTIGTGKEYSDRVKIWGYDLVKPTEEFSVSHFQKFARTKIKEISEMKTLPILVGGTGLYIKAVIDDINTTAVPPNISLRETLSTKSASELFTFLNSLNHDKAVSLNNSDKNNPRRLIRAIEISQYDQPIQSSPVLFNTLFIGLKSEMSVLEKRIKNAIDRRIEMGFIDEVKKLLSQGITPETKSMSATGYKEIAMYIQNKISLEQAIEKWYLSERKYVKRQLTWFNKRSDIQWFDISEPSYKSRVEEVVVKWHNSICLEK